jgi:imidazoleglycerol-phosphate dehydratase
LSHRVPALIETARPRRAALVRETRETTIDLSLDLDGGTVSIASDVKFLNHMLEAFAKHSGCGLVLKARGDGMDHHHLVEDVGIVLGTAIAQALGDKHGIVRFGSLAVPLDDALVLASVDLSGRAFLNCDLRFTAEQIGDLKAELVPHFFRSVSENGRFNLHLLQLAGTNAHHLCEAAFKAFARAFAQAKATTGAMGAPSTKGLLA